MAEEYDQTLRLKLDSVNSQHVHQTLFFDGRNCGSVCLSHGEYQTQTGMLMAGAELMNRNHRRIKLTIDCPKELPD